MKKVVIIIIILLIFCIFVFLNNNESNKDYNYNNVVVSEENFEENLTTEVTLFFLDESNNIIAETREIEANNLIDNPYKYVITLLKNEGETENKKNILNENFEIIDCTINGNILNIKVTNSFEEIYKNDMDKVKDVIRSLVTQFKEISDITIEDETGKIL